jgi:hypothetical protein
LKAARQAVNSRQVWNGSGFRLSILEGKVCLKRDDPDSEKKLLRGRIILSRNEITDIFRVSLGKYRISVALEPPDGDGFLSFSIRKWPIEIIFGPEGISVTENSSEGEQPDVGTVLVYIFTEHLEEGIDAR